MDAFISLSYQKHFDHVGEFFGKEIKFSFWDEPAMHPVDGRMWTGSSTRDSRKSMATRHEVLPGPVVRHRPRHRGGPQRAIRYRAYLFATNYVKKIEDFCEAHASKRAAISTRRRS